MGESEAKRIFVTGGTGFVGLALVRDLVRTQRRAILLTRDPRRVPDDLHGKVKVVRGDLRNPQSYDEHLKGGDAVIHCAKTDAGDPAERAQLDVEASRTLVSVAVAQGVRRFVHVSTVSVYGNTESEVVDENSPRESSGDHYANSKIQIEEELVHRKDSIEVIVLQPANIYGPGPCWWSHTILSMMRRGKIILVNDGQGVANMVHVADVVQSINLALDADGVQGECFIISDGAPLSWKDYFKHLEKIIGRESTIALPASEAKELSRRLLNRGPAARLRRLFDRAFLNEPLVFPLTDYAIDKFACQATFSIAKARLQLRYQPMCDIQAGMKTVNEFETTSEQRLALQLVATQNLAARNS